MTATSDYQAKAMDLLEYLRAKYNFSQGATFLGIATADDISEDPYTAMANILSHKETSKSDEINHFIENYHGLSGKTISTIFEEDKKSYEDMENAFKKVIG